MAKKVFIAILRGEGGYLHSRCIAEYESTLSWLFKTLTYALKALLRFAAYLITFWGATHVCFEAWRRRRVLANYKLTILLKINILFFRDKDKNYAVRQKMPFCTSVQ